jgi:mannose-1-phosphate guanylyltransferase
MRAVVLVGGFGTRLRPLTTSTPKQMLPVVNRPMIERVLEHLGRHGVEQAVLSLGYRPDAFTEAYPAGRCGGVSLHYAVEPEPLDTAGAIRFAADDAGIRDRFLVVNGDVLTDLDVTVLVDEHARSGAEATIALHRVDDPTSYGVVATDGGGRVTAFVEKPPPGEAPSDLINAGTYVFEPAALDRIPPGERVNVERVVFPAMAVDEVLHAWDGDTYWIDAGTASTYLQAQLDLIDGTRGAAEDGVHRTAEVEGSVRRAVLGAGSTVSAGARVDAAVLLPGAAVGRGATVECSIVGPGARIGDGAVVRGGAVLGDGVLVPPGTTVDGERIPAPA